MTLSPNFDPQTVSYSTALEQAGNVAQSYNIMPTTKPGQTVNCTIDSASSADMKAKIVTIGANKAVTIGDGSLTEGDTGTVIVNVKVAHENTYATKTYQIAINVTITADEIIDADIPGD